MWLITRAWCVYRTPDHGTWIWGNNEVGIHSRRSCRVRWWVQSEWSAWNPRKCVASRGRAADRWAGGDGGRTRALRATIDRLLSTERFWGRLGLFSRVKVTLLSLLYCSTYNIIIVTAPEFFQHFLIGTKISFYILLVEWTKINKVDDWWNYAKTLVPLSRLSISIWE